MNTKIIGITGGIGSGKSYVCRIIEQHKIPIFYTDIEAKLEMAENRQIHRELRALIGNDVIDAEGRIVKAVIADYICRSNEYAERVNAIVHPRVRERMLKWAQSDNADSSRADEHSHAASGQRLKMVECALLFESGFHTDCDYTIAVVAPLETRIARIMQRDDISREKALEWINLQMPQEQKADLADHIIVNDGTTPLIPQIDKVFSSILNA